MVRPHDGSISTMSNPLNNFRMPDDRWKPYQIKSIVFDSNGGHAVAINEVDRGLSIME